MMFVRLFGWIVGGILASIALYMIGGVLLSMTYAIAVAVYWVFVSVLVISVVFLVFGIGVMLGHWMWPSEIDITYIPYEEGEEFV
jgi:hypothetical protein